jgi:hypothetical protein
MITDLGSEKIKGSLPRSDCALNTARLDVNREAPVFGAQGLWLMVSDLGFRVQS